MISPKDFLSVSSEYFDEPKKFLRILENCLLRTLKRAVRQEQFSLRNPKKLLGAKSTVHERWIKNPTTTYQRKWLFKSH